MIDEAILRESRKARLHLLKNLACDDIDNVEFRLRQLVNECLTKIITSHHNLPPRTYNRSNQYLAIKVPSQRLKDIEQELAELIIWFKGGKKPRSREWISGYAIAAMIGDAPFGKTIIAATKHKVTRIDDAINRHRLDSKRIYSWDILSSDDVIRKGQIAIYSNLWDEEGNRLFLELIPLGTKWPDSFKRLVQRDPRPVRLRLRDLQAALAPDDLKCMVDGMTGARHIIQFMRGSSDHKSKMTIERWMGCEPGFWLINAMLDVIWPYPKGQPRANTRGERRAGGDQSQRQLLGDLAQNLVDLVQENLDASREFESAKYEQVRAPKHFLGDQEHYLTQVSDMTSLILSLRKELISYFVARYTITDICEAAFRQDDEDIIAAANCIIGPVVDRIESRLAFRRTLLNCGTDHLRASVFKWCGRLDPDARQRWQGENDLAAMVFPAADPDRDRHLTLYGDLIRSFEPDANTQLAWNRLSAWAGDPRGGRTFWRVVIPEADDGGEFSTEELILG